MCDCLQTGAETWNQDGHVINDWERQRVRNDDSIVLELRWRDVSVLLTGDIGKSVERGVASTIPPAPLRIVKVAHHGSLTSSSPEFVQATRVLGLRDLQIIFREILPNALPPVIVYASVVMAVSILLESALAFLNLSDPNVASWGNLIGAGRGVLRTQWYVSAIPGVAIIVTVLAVSLVGQGLNDALNPRLKKR